jgi:hypothetical protein
MSLYTYSTRNGAVASLAKPLISTPLSRLKSQGYAHKYLISDAVCADARSSSAAEGAGGAGGGVLALLLRVSLATQLLSAAVGWWCVGRATYLRTLCV